MDRHCPICGTVVTDARRVYCCASCAADARRQHNRDRQVSHERGGIYRWIICPDCGQRVWRHIKCKRCDACQRVADKQHSVQSAAAQRAGHARQLGAEYPCERCGEPYTLEGGRQRYCKACAGEAVRDTIRARARERMQAVNATAEGRERRKAQRSAQREPQETICTQCGVRFSTTNARRKYCSEACAKEAQRMYLMERDKARKLRK